VQALLQLPARKDLSAFDGMLEELPEKAAGVFSQPVDENDDLHGWIEITQVENHFGNANQRTSRNQDRRTEELMPGMVDGRFIAAYFGDLAAGGEKALFQKPVVIAANQHDLTARAVAEISCWHRHLTLGAPGSMSQLGAGFRLTGRCARFAPVIYPKTLILLSRSIALPGSWLLKVTVAGAVISRCAGALRDTDNAAARAVASAISYVTHDLPAIASNLA
jgi:hypothetical protein